MMPGALELDPELLAECNESLVPFMVVAPDYGVARLWMGRMGLNSNKARIIVNARTASVYRGAPSPIIFVLDDERISADLRDEIHYAFGPAEPRIFYRDIDADHGVYRS